MSPDISVIMGVYNAEDSGALRKSIYSILNQTYKNIEFIICDDGSTDESYNIIKEISEEDNRVIALQNNKNLGLARTLNRCIKVCNGKYVARQDADDYSHLERLQRQWDFLENNKQYSFIGSNIRLFDKNGEWGTHTYKSQPTARDFLWGSQFNHGSTMFRMRDLILCGYYRACKKTLRCEDYDLYMRMYQMKMIGYNLEEPVYYFREDENSLSRRKYRYRVDEAIIRFENFSKMGLMPVGLFYVFKPLLVGLIPNKILHDMKNKYYKRF